MTQFFGLSAALAFALAPASAYAQPAPAAETSAATQAVGAGESTGPEAEEIEEILVIGSRARGSVVGTIQPVLQLDAGDIRATGAGSLADLLQELSPQTRSGGGRGGEQPVVLINGKRVSGFSEIRNIPPEAIERVDILPEAVSLSYGFRADQRVINFVLRDQFRAVTGELELGGPTAGGRSEVEIDANVLQLSGDSRLIIDLEYQHQTRLLESARNIIPTTSTRPFDLRGNIVGGFDGQEIDPALSALAGTTVTVAGVPLTASAGAPTLDDFVPGANNPNVTDEGDDRTLLPEARQFSLGGSLARPLSDRVQATFSGRVELSDSEARLGLPTAILALPAGNPFSPFGADTQLLRMTETQGPLLRSAKGWNGRLAAVFNGDLVGWRWSLTASHEHASSETLTDRGIDVSDIQARVLAGDPTLNPFGETILVGALRQDRATSNSDTSVLDMLANGRLLDLPAGGLMATLKAGYEHRDLTSETVRGPLVIGGDLQRGLARGQASFDIPISSRNRDVLGWLGTLSLNLNVSVDDLSDFGTLTSIGYGLNWVPIEPLRLSASVTEEDGAPSIQQLGDPVIATPNVRVFDYTQGETVEITRIDGGNKALSADRRRVLKLGGTLNPIAGTDLTVLANYVDSRIEGSIASFPTATAEIEAAFPDRFLRGPDGRLLQIDNRPVNFLRSDRRELRWGVTFSERLEPGRAEREAMEKRRAELEEKPKAATAAGKPMPGLPAGTGPGTGGGPMSGGPGSGGQGGGPGGGRWGGPEGRLQLSLFHTWRLEDSILIREGVPKLDLLDGSATGSRGGVSRHEVEGRAGVNKNGLGARFSVNWQSGTEVRVDPSGAESPDDLRFSSLATLNMRVFADLGQQRSIARSQPWLRGARVSVGIYNLLDSRLRVQDRSGAEPLAYQADLLDPVGRRFEMSFRKIFF